MRRAVSRDGRAAALLIAGLALGDQDSDVAGGHARRAFKLPNPRYFIS